jgi:hypothetical protein
VIGIQIIDIAAFLGYLMTGSTELNRNNYLYAQKPRKTTMLS